MSKDIIEIDEGGKIVKPDLSAQELNFVRLVAKDYTYTQAYRMAFPASKKLSNYTVRSNASRLATKSNISTEIQTAIRTQARLARLAEDRITEVLEDGSIDSKTNKVADVAMFMYEQTNGKAIQKIEAKSQLVTVIYDLTGQGQSTEIPQEVLDQLALAG